ncbi:hypothetical protein Tcan_03968 [Toxocara canis]|nr:hypothetical protein Tcan_03968 [Toxocara canis]
MKVEDIKTLLKAEKRISKGCKCIDRAISQIDPKLGRKVTAMYTDLEHKLAQLPNVVAIGVSEMIDAALTFGRKESQEALKKVGKYLDENPDVYDGVVTGIYTFMLSDLFKEWMEMGSNFLQSQNTSK